ncbi:MAG: hypothetical protein EA361_00725, partial [Bacteroidetes bacterium]
MRQYGNHQNLQFMQYTKFNLLLVFFLLISSAGFAQKTLTGVVFDSSGNTLPGATVVVPGTTTGATTNIDGEFSLELREDQNQIEVSFIGYLPEIINVEGLDYIEVVLMESIEQLQEVIVTALGIKRDAKA